MRWAERRTPMLEEVRITSLGVIEDAQLELSPGFTVVTGETGAGKTMVVTSLNLLFGGRADFGLVRAGGDRAFIEGRLGLPSGSEAVLLAEDAGAELDDGSLIIGRTISSDARSRAVVGGRSVPVGLLGDIGDDLIAMHGQNDQ